MFIAIDVGNTSIVYGVMDEERIYFSSTLSTDWQKTSDEYAVILRDILHIHEISTKEIEGGIVSSVVPKLKRTMLDAVRSITGKDCIVVGPGVKNGLRIRIDDPAQLGGDSVCNAVAAIAEYPQPTLIFDMGTATTISVIGKQGDYLGGMILPGALVSMDALINSTSQLPQIGTDEQPKGLIGTNTVECLRSGFIYGNAAMMDGVIARVAEALGEEPTVVATGEATELITAACTHEVIVDQELMLKGLRRIYLKNSGPYAAGRRNKKER